MPNFRFEELLAITHIEKRARRVTFHPRATVLKGQNNTGKSSLIKTIFRTFGAVPHNITPRWKAAKISSLVRFSVDGVRYSIYCRGNTYSLFLGAQLLGIYKSVTNELSPALSEIFDFHLSLLDRRGEIKLATPAFLFLPFYIDQDQGWTKPLASFDRLSQFKNSKREALQYHTGLRPHEWYILNAKARQLHLQREEPVQRELVLVNVMRRLESQLSTANFDFDVSSFKREINRLLRRCNELRQMEQQYKEKLIELETEKIRVLAQRDIVIHARKELDADYEYASRLRDDHVDCPTCGAMYSNDIGSRFEIAQDEDKCVTLLEELDEALDKVESAIARHRETLSEQGKELARVNAILTEKQGRMTLKTIIEAEGKRELASNLQAELGSLQNTISQFDATIREVEESISDLDDRDRRQRLLNLYREKLQEYCDFLTVRELDDKAFSSMDARITGSGSDLPRALLAFFLSVSQTIELYGHYSSFPLVIDAPNQQEQDPENIKRILKAFRECSPPDAQLILGTVDDYGVDFGGSIVEMNEPSFALSQDEYDEVSEMLAPYADATLG